MSDFAIAPPKAGVAGRYKFEKFKGNVLTGETPWFNNQITDVGLDALAGTEYLKTCSVGSGNAEPQFTDTQLQALVRSSTTANLNQNGAEQKAPYRVWTRIRYVFSPVWYAYNISEVGVGPSSTLLLSRSLIKDALGNPTTISVLGDETLYVTFEFSIMVPEEDNTGTLVFTGNVGGTHNFICRAARCTNVESSLSFLGWGIRGSNSDSSTYVNGFASASTTGTSGNSYYTFTEGIGGVTGQPSGGEYTSPRDVTAVPYAPGTHYAEFVRKFGLTSNNHNIRSMVYRIGPCSYQFQFDPPIPKTNSRQLFLTFRHSWGRYEP